MAARLLMNELQNKETKLANASAHIIKAYSFVCFISWVKLYLLNLLRT